MFSLCLALLFTLHAINHKLHGYTKIALKIKLTSLFIAY